MSPPSDIDIAPYPFNGCQRETELSNEAVQQIYIVGLQKGCTWSVG